MPLTTNFDIHPTKQLGKKNICICMKCKEAEMAVKSLN